MKENSDKELIKRCLKGKSDAQRMLYNKYAGLLYAICFRYCKNAEDASDTLQETFINVFTNLKHFNFEGSFEGWVRKIAVNCAIKQYHKTAKRIDSGDIDLSPDAETYADAIDSLNAQDLINLINQLPDGYRIVFNMYAIEGYSHKEIGEKLGIAESASRSQLTRARKQLITLVGVPEPITQGQ